MLDPKDFLEAHILIVDDRTANVQLLENLLHDAGYLNLMSTQDPTVVCELHQTYQFDLILLDIQMPVMDGFKVMADLIKMETKGDYTPILAMTVQPSHKLRALASGAKDFIAKPFELMEVKARIHNMLEVRLLYKKLEKSISALASFAMYDALTKLPNRRLLMQRLIHTIAFSGLDHGQCALMFMDIDYFKQINDTLGHDVGDLLLQQVGERLLKCVRKDDIVARFGGDEFVVLIVELSHDTCEASAQAEVIAQNMRRSVGKTFHLNGQAYDTSLSIGVVVFSGDQEPIGNILKKADLAMYQAKVDGRNTVRIFDAAMQNDWRVHDALVHNMHEGLELHEFALYYQIQVDVQGVPMGVEALPRWNHTSQGQMMASQFIPLAEETGMILALNHWMLDAACQQLQMWSNNPQTAILTMAVNISFCKFALADFVSRIAHVLYKTGANPHRLVLELSEYTLNSNVKDVIAKMNAIKVSGVRFSINDFGTGLSSLANLRQLPLDQLKIAPSFVSNMLTNDIDDTIVRGMVAFGSRLGLKVIAVGVENAQQHQRLVGMACTAFQGDFYGHAQLADDLVKVWMGKQALGGCRT